MGYSILIRTLDPASDLDRIVAFYSEAPDYWIFAEGAVPGPEKAAAFFTDGPPGSSPEDSHRLGLFLEGRLSGLAELSFGFPEAGDAYLGLMILGPWAQRVGHGATFLAHVEELARLAGASRLYLAVIEANSRGRAFWEREGFGPTGVSRVDMSGGRNHVLYRFVKSL